MTTNPNNILGKYNSIFGINIVWETTLPEEATEVVINAKGDTVHRILPVRVCVKRRVPKPATAKKAKSSKKKVDNVPFA